MNDMNETILEIRRRGEQRIRARKQLRNRIAAACVPVVLCAAVLWAVPKGEPVSMVIPVETVQWTQGETNQTVLETISVSLRITGQGYDVSRNDPETVESFLNAIGQITEIYYTTAYAADQSMTRGQTLDPVDAEGLLICVEEEGETVEYVLYQRTLYDTRKGKAYPISSYGYQELLRILGLEPL